MKYVVVPFEGTPSSEEQWDRFCASTVNGTFLHSRRFLSYHGSRFKDRSVVILEDGRPIALFPAAEDPEDVTRVVSHPGSTYGGLVHTGYLTGERMLAAIEALCAYYAERRYLSLTYKAVPHIYARVPAQDDLYALFRSGASRVRCDLSSTVKLKDRLPLNERRRRALRKAINGVVVSWDTALLPNLWLVVSENLSRRHGATPVHDLAELAELSSRFPESIRLACALKDNRVVAGVVLFNSASVWHAQYIAASEEGYALNALDVVFNCVMDRALEQGVEYFDFGTSNESDGAYLNAGLYRFKTEFGGGGVAHEFYQLNLQ